MASVARENRNKRSAGQYYILTSPDSNRSSYRFNPGGNSAVDIPRIQVSHHFIQTTCSLQHTVGQSLAEVFSMLHKKWIDEIDGISNFNFAASHPDYLKIIGLGSGAIKFILEDLANDGGPWFTALASITRVENEVVPNEHLGKARLMRDDWLRWGEKHGYFTGRIQSSSEVSGRS